MRESMIIIPGVEIDEVPNFYQALCPEIDRHGKAVKEFCEENDIVIPDELLEDESWNGYSWSKMVASFGHFAIQVAPEFIVFYIPPLINKRQYQWFRKNKSLLRRYQDIIFAYSYEIKDNELVEETLIEFPDDESFMILGDEIKEKYQLYLREREEICMKSLKLVQKL